MLFSAQETSTAVGVSIPITQSLSLDINTFLKIRNRPHLGESTTFQTGGLTSLSLLPFLITINNSLSYLWLRVATNVVQHKLKRRGTGFQCRINSLGCLSITEQKDNFWHSQMPDKHLHCSLDLLMPGPMLVIPIGAYLKPELGKDAHSCSPEPSAPQLQNTKVKRGYSLDVYGPLSAMVLEGRDFRMWLAHEG